MISTSQSKYFIWLRFISVIVLFTFITTQFDLQGAYALTSSSPLPVSVDQKNSLDKKDLFGDIRYSEDFSKREKEPTPEVTLQNYQAPQPVTPPEEIKFSDFTETEKPLATAGKEATCKQEGSFQTCYVPNTDIPDCSAQGAQCAYYESDLKHDNRITKIADFTNPVVKNKLELKEFTYNDQAKTVQIVTRGIGSDDVDTFQTYLLEPGTYNPETLVRSGIVLKDVDNQDQFLALRAYN